MKSMVDFVYTGVLDVGKRRLRTLRVSAFDLGMGRLVELIDHKVDQLAYEDQDETQYGTLILSVVLCCRFAL